MVEKGTWLLSDISIQTSPRKWEGYGKTPSMIITDVFG